MANSAIHPFQRTLTHGAQRSNQSGRNGHTGAAVQTSSLAGGPALALARAQGHLVNRVVEPAAPASVTNRKKTPSVKGELVATEAADGSSTKYLERILVRKARRMLLVRTADIELIEAAGNYVRINTADAQHLLRSPLTELVASLDPTRFLRIHRSAVVNTDFLESVETNPAGDYYVRLPSGRRLKCSRSYRAGLRHFLESFGS